MFEEIIKEIINSTWDAREKKLVERIVMAIKEDVNNEELTIEQIADELKKNRKTIINWTKKRKNGLKYSRPGKEYLISRKDLNQFLEQNKFSF